ncbi:MAG: hypothetical protein JSS99_04940 [Actinobacteria bacterium]|nr:hypothetical protein [Actinomycetota bacterium]
MSRSVRLPLAGLLALAALVAGGLAAPAAAPADGQPALDQYVPSMPSADGEHVRPSAAGTAPLPGALARRLARAPGGAVLRAVAESRALGAPPASARARTRHRGEPPPVGAGTALFGAAGSGAGLALLAVPLLLVAVVAAALLRAARLRRTRQ